MCFPTAIDTDSQQDNATVKTVVLYVLIFTRFDRPVPMAMRSSTARTPGSWVRGFESRSRDGCVIAFFYVVFSCAGSGLATG